MKISKMQPATMKRTREQTLLRGSVLREQPARPKRSGGESSLKTSWYSKDIERFEGATLPRHKRGFFGSEAPSELSGLQKTKNVSREQCSRGIKDFDDRRSNPQRLCSISVAASFLIIFAFLFLLAVTAFAQNADGLKNSTMKGTIGKSRINNQSSFQKITNKAAKTTGAADDFWQQTNGPYGGYINALAINSSGYIFAGTQGSGVYLSTNNGTSWVQTSLPNLYISSLAINSSDYIFAGTDNNGVYLSTNNGTSWAQTSLQNLYISSLAINSTGYIFAGTWSGDVYLSKNNGTSWTQVNNGLMKSSITSLAINSSDYIFAGTWSGGVYLSINNGSSWTQTNLMNEDILSLAINSSGYIFAACDNNGVYLSANNGTSWMNVSNDLSGYARSLAINSSGYIFAGAIGGVYLSMNNGASWTQINNGLPNSPNMNSLVVSFAINSSGYIFAGRNDRGIYLSIDNGMSWAQVNNGLKNSYVNSLDIDYSGNIFAGTWSGIHLSTDSGTNWKQVNNGLTNSNIYSLTINSSNYIFAGTDNGINLSTNNGTSWTQVGLASVDVQSLAINSSGNIFAGTGYGVYLSTDDGSNWTMTNNGMANYHVNSFAINSSGYVFAGTDSNGVYLSTDNGTNWSQVGLANIAVPSLAINSSGYIFAGTKGGGVYLSTNNGSSWAPIINGLTNSSVQSLAINSLGYIFAGTSGGVFRSTNNGASWTQINSGLTNSNVQSFAINSSGYIFAGTNGGGVYRSVESTTEIPPAAPQNLTAKVGNAQVTLKWNKNTETNFLKYRIYRGTTSGGETLVDSSSASVTDTTKTLSGLTNGTIYYFRITAVNSSGMESAYSNEVSATPTNITTITSFTPTSGPIGTTVNITGINFNSTASSNVVCFGAVKATVTAATSTSLTVTVPIGATYQPITVTNVTTGLTAYSSKPFVVTFTGGGSITSSSFAANVDFTTGSGPFSVAICDVDGDGKPDLVVANYSSNTISVFRNTSTIGSVSFAAKVDFTAGGGAYSAAIGDVDGDGKPDLVVVNKLSNTVSVFRNTSTIGSVSFAAKVDFPTLTTPYSVTIGDVDGDGKPDLVVANYGSSTISVFRNTGTIGSVSFAAKVDFPTWPGPLCVAIGDVDGDGKPDLAVVNNASSTVSVFRNTSTIGSVSFDASVDFTTGSYPYSVAIGDVDGDGKPDLAVANNASSTISVLRNTGTVGSVSFAARVDFTTGSAPYSVAIGDVDGDGKPDLAAANCISNTISILRNTGTIGSVSFAAKVDFTTGSSPYGVTISDVDGDGKPDMVVANQGSNSVSVLRNTIGAGNTTPATPQNLTATAGNGQVTLKWNKNTEADFLKYRIYCGTTSGSETLVDSSSASITDTTKTISGLTNGTTYYFKVTVTSTARLESGYSNEVSATPTALALPIVTTNPANSITNNSAVLYAAINPNGSGTSAYFEWGTDNTLTTVSQTPQQATGSGTDNIIFSASIGGLSPSTTYYYRAAAQNNSGTQRGSILSFVTTPSAVTLQSPKNQATNQLLDVKFSWTQAAGATKYHLQVSTDQSFNSSIVFDSTFTSLTAIVGLLSCGTTYYWHVSAVNNSGESPFSPTSEFSTIPSPPEKIDVNQTFNFPQRGDISNYTKQDYQIIGLPGSSNQSIQKYLSGGEMSDWEVYWDNGDTANYYIKYDGGSNFILTAGKGFWLISKNNINLNISVQAAAMNNNYEVEIPLHSGWNLVTNPFNSSMSWSNVENANGISAVIYGYSGGSYSQSPKFDPYMGYYFFNGTPNTTLSTLRVPYQSIYANIVSTETLAKNDWRVNVKLQSAGIVDKSVSFGVSQSASVGLNKYNFRKPRALTALPEIHFDRTDWDSNYPAFASDIRPSIGEVERWQLSVNGKQGASAKLVFGGISKVPASCAVFLVDSVHAMFADLRKDSAYEFTQPTNSASMTILVGSPEKVEKEAESVLPVRYELSRNFPNPFNPSTNFLVRLPAASQVTIRVYNILGQMVREIYHGNLDVGQHWFTWDGRNQNQQKMSSGVYYCRLEVSGKLSQSIKMVLIN